MAFSLRLIFPALLAAGILTHPLAIFADGRGLAVPGGRALRFEGLLGRLRGGEQSVAQTGPGTGKPIQLNTPPGTDKPTKRQQACLKIDAGGTGRGLQQVSRGKGQRGRGGRKGFSSVSSGTDPPKTNFRCVASHALLLRA